MRITKEHWGMSLALVTAERSTCARRNVGCVLFDEEWRVLATGYNGVPKGFVHCNESYRCSGASAPSGVSLDLCKAIHAEQNALMQCADVNKIAYAFVTVSPCIHCMKMLLNTSCKVIYARAIYDKEAVSLWTEENRKLVLYE